MEARKPVIIDGIVCPKQYNDAKTKVAFLLKEVNNEAMDKDWDFTEWLYKQSTTVEQEENSKFHNTFANICRWLAVVYNPDISFLQCADYIKHKHLLAKAAVININKHGGKPNSNQSLLADIAVKNRKQLAMQIETISPDIVVCGGTFWLAENKIYQENDENAVSRRQKVMQLPCGARYFLTKHTVFLEFVHPAWYTVDRKILFAYFKTAYSEISVVLKSHVNCVSQLP